MKKILVICTGNSCRSQIAEAYLRHFAAGKAAVYSAGIETHGLNPRAVETMAEDGLDITGQQSDNVLEYRDMVFDYIITVCDHARETCPFFPGNALRFHESFPDPAKAQGTEEEIKAAFRSVREQIKTYSQQFVNQYV